MGPVMAEQHLEFLVEEPSQEAFLQELLPSHLPNGITFQIHAHRGKGDLLTKLAGRLRGYAKYLPADWRIFVLVERDADDCQKLKQRLEDMSAQIGLRTRTRAGGNSWQVVNRIVIEELEAWYFGDPEAICNAYPRVALRTLKQAHYRNPDAISGGTWEALERVLQKNGYFRSGIRKVEAAQTIAAHIAPQRNRSRSFQVFYAAILDAAGM